MTKPIGRLTAELVIVFVGVLIALFVENWRENLVDRRDERIVLTGLASEFADNRERLDLQLSIYGRRLSAQTEILGAISGAETPTADSLDVLLAWTLRGGTVDLADGALNGTLASGDLGLLRDDRLRNLLGRWPSEVENLRDVETRFNVLTTEHLLPWMRVRVSLPSHIGESELPSTRRPVDVGALLDDPTFENFLREQVYWGEAIQEASAELRDLILIIEDRIGRGGED